METIGLLRRGCNFCVVCPDGLLDGQPCEERSRRTAVSRCGQDIHEEPPPEDDFLDPDLETKDKEVEAEVKATVGRSEEVFIHVFKTGSEIGKEYRALLKWREARLRPRILESGGRALEKDGEDQDEAERRELFGRFRGSREAGHGPMHEKLTSLDETVDLDDMDGWPVVHGTFLQKGLVNPIPFARRTQAPNGVGEPLFCTVGQHGCPEPHGTSAAPGAVTRFGLSLSVQEGKLVESNIEKKRFDHFMEVQTAWGLEMYVEADDLDAPIMVGMPRSP